MEPGNHSHDSSSQPETTGSTPIGGDEANGKNGEHRFWPFEGPPPPRLTPEEIQELLKLWTEEDEKRAAQDLRDILENGGGYQLADFLPELKRSAGIDD